MTRERHWSTGPISLGRIQVRVVYGTKGPDDMRLDVRTPGGEWSAIPMALTFLTADFFSENEDALLPYRPTWRESGPGYFLKKVSEAVRVGWEPVTNEIERQRRRRSA